MNSWIVAGLWVVHKRRLQSRGGVAKRWYYLISLFIKSDDVFYERPLCNLDECFKNFIAEVEVTNGNNATGAISKISGSNKHFSRGQRFCFWSIRSIKLSRTEVPFKKYQHVLQKWRHWNLLFKVFTENSKKHRNFVNNRLRDTGYHPLLSFYFF